jgi:hypothetical protein
MTDRSNEADMTPELYSRLDDLITKLERGSKHLLDETREIERGENFEALLLHFAQYRVLHDRLIAMKKHYESTYEELSRHTIPDAIEIHVQNGGLKPPYYLEGYGRISISRRYTASMLDKKAGMKWLKDNGYAEMVQETVNAQTLAGFARNLEDTEGKELPDTIFKVGRIPYTSITKG